MLRSIAVLLALVLGGNWVPAAIINWDSPSNISGDSDVSTNGSLVGAFNFGGSATTINGVNFQAFALGASSNTVGDFTLSTGSGNIGTSTTSEAVAPFSSLSSAYKALLGTAASKADTTFTLTMANLTIGLNYEFQVWANDSRDTGAGQFVFDVDITAGNTVTLAPNTSAVIGGTGQYVAGTFTADGTIQTVDFFASEVGIVNGFQLRQTAAINPPPPPGNQVPLPLAFWPGLMVGGFVLHRVARKRRQAC